MLSKRQVATERSTASHRMVLAFLIAVGIGLHNLGEGLAVIAPILRVRSGIGQLALLGLVGGAPAVVGAWIGGCAPSPTLAVLFLAIGAGAARGSSMRSGNSSRRTHPNTPRH